MKARLAVLITAASLTAGCSSSGSSNTTTGDDVGVTSSSPAEPGNDLSGFGANIATWRQHHQADPDQKLVPDCCFGPTVDAPENGGTQDTWYAVMVDDKTGEVYGFSHAFAPHTDEATATAAVAQDLPADADLIDSKVGDGCKLFVYRSAQLAAQTHLGPFISVFFETSADPDVNYDPNDVSDAGLSTQNDSSLGSC